MTRARATLLSIVAILAGGGLLFYLGFYVSPRQDEGELNPLALVGFFIGLILLIGGLGALAALALHERWPALAGATAGSTKNGRPTPTVALRQGGLLAAIVAALAALSMVGLLDPAFVIVAFVLGGLVEAYFQRG
jgi:hypothetical protein